MGGLERQKDDPIGALRPTVAQVARDGVAHVRIEGQYFLAPALGSDDQNPPQYPVDIIQPQSPNLAGAHPVHREQQKEGMIAQRRWILADRGLQHTPDLVPRGTHRQALMSVQTRP